MGLRRGGSKPGERRGGRQKGSRNKASLPAVQAAIKEEHPNLDPLTLQRQAAAGILVIIEKARNETRSDAKVLVDWYVKLARVAEGMARLLPGAKLGFAAFDPDNTNPAG